MSGQPAPVTLDAVELVRLRLPLVRTFTTSFGAQSERDLLLVHVRTRDGVDGWGECAAPAAPTYSEEFTDAAALVLRDHLVPRALAPGACLDVPRLADRVAGIRGNRMARAALETSLLDAQLRSAGVSLADHLGVRRDRVPAGVSVGIPAGGSTELVEQVAAYLEEGYLRIKIKVEPGFDVGPVTALREHFGASLALQVDANAAYDPDERDHATALTGLDQAGLTMIEQPFGADRLRDHARLAATSSTPICLDESIHDALRARDAIACGATGVVNVKVGRVGGLTEAVRVRDICRQHRVPVWCGGMLESGVGRAVNVALAGLDGFELTGDLSASDRYWHQDITEPFVLDAGHLPVPRSPGIGRVPAPEALTAARRTRIWP